MRRLWIVAVALLLAACGSRSETVWCGPCAGPGFVATGIPPSVDHGRVIMCVGDETCTRTELTGPMLAKSQQFVELADKGPGWQRYDGRPVQVSVVSDGRRWQGAGDFVFHDAGDAPCSCSTLLAEVALSRVG